MDISKEEQESFLQARDAEKGNARLDSLFRRMWPYMRLLVEVAMVLCIFVLSTNLSRPKSPHSLQKTPIPDRKRIDPAKAILLPSLMSSLVPRKLYTFNEDRRYLNEEMFNSEEETMHTLHQWIPLSAGESYWVSLSLKCLVI